MRRIRHQDFLTGFSERLNRALQKKGQVSYNSKYGVRIAELAKVAECSIQMAHRYINGKAMPDYLTAKCIADWLEVPAGTLLYGEKALAEKCCELSFDEKIVEHVLQKVLPHYITPRPERAVEMIVKLLKDLRALPVESKHKFSLVDVISLGLGINVKVVRKEASLALSSTSI